MTEDAAAQTEAEPTAGTVEEEIIQRATLSYERLPMLEVVFDRFALALGTALKNHVGTPAEVRLKSFDYMTTGEALKALPAPQLVAVTSVEPWEGNIALVIDPALLFTTLELMLGGRTAPRSGWEPRSFTSIERRIGKQLADVILRRLSDSFDHVTAATFTVDHLESSPQAMVLAPPASSCVRVTMTVVLEDRGGTITFILPGQAMEKVRATLAQAFLGGKLGGDSSWRAQLTESLQDTNIALTAVLHQLRLPLTDVLHWKRGQVLDLGIDASHEVTVTCGDRDMFRAAMGRRKNGSVALRVTEELSEKDGIADDTAD
jgi:flagellar motor switch protein FliM